MRASTNSSSTACASPPGTRSLHGVAASRPSRRTIKAAMDKLAQPAEGGAAASPTGRPVISGKPKLTLNGYRKLFERLAADALDKPPRAFIGGIPSADWAKLFPLVKVETPDQELSRLMVWAATAPFNEDRRRVPQAHGRNQAPGKVGRGDRQRAPHP